MLKTWIKYSTPECRNIIREVLSSHAKGNIGVPTQELYDLAAKQFPDAKTPTPSEKFYPPNTRGRRGKVPMPVPEPPNRDHPIRSMRYLKRVVLEDMVERNEIEKVHITRGKSNEDGQRLDLVKSKTAGTEYQPDVIIEDKMEVWVWRLRQPGDSMDVREVWNMKKTPRRLPRSHRDSESRAHPPHTRQPGTSSPRPHQSSSSPRNSEKTPPWAGEYSAKRDSGEGPLRPRFHMSWGAHWKGKSSARVRLFEPPIIRAAETSPNHQPLASNTEPPVPQPKP